MMHWSIRTITTGFLTVFSVVLLLSAAFVYMVVTPLGGKMLVRYFKYEFCSAGLMHVGHDEGTLQNGFILRDVHIIGLSYLPAAPLFIQEIRVRVPWWDPFHFDCSIFNARILIPGSEPVVFTGRVYGGQIKGSLYSRSVDVHEASRFWAIKDIRKDLRGYISNVDMAIQGPLSSPGLSGYFLADNIRYKSILLTDGFSRLKLMLMPVRGRMQVKGEVIVDSGLVNVRGKNLELSQSKFIFQGDILNPAIDIRMGAKVGDMNIDLAVKGTLANPQLIVSSDPPMPPQEALQVLFTGNAWEAATSPFNGITSGELAENFLDYSPQGINDQQQLGFKTKLTNNFKLGAEMDQLPLPVGDTNTYYSRKVKGEMAMNDHMSLNISQEVLPQDRGIPQTSQDAQSGAETQVYLQYKERF